MLKINKNKFNFFEIAKPTATLWLTLWYFKTYQLAKNNNKLTKGPAKAIKNPSKALTPAGIETKAGAKIKKGELINFNTTPRPKPNQ